MSVIQQTADETILKCENWCRLAICVNYPVKSALIAILHNTVAHPSINGLPKDSTLLFNHLYNCRNTLKNNKFLKKNQLAELLPQEGKVDSESLDVTLLRFLIRTFCNIVNEDGHWGEPRHDDHSIAAGVFRAANMRNRVFHYKDPNAMEDIEFETMWCEIEVILADLCYVEDISGFKVNSLDPVKAKKLKEIHDSMKEDFEKILVAYKEKCKNDENEELDTFVKRKFKDKNTKDIIQDFNRLVNNHDLVMVSGKAGLGKTFSAKHLRHLWASDKILQGCSLLFINSKRVNKDFSKRSNASLISVTELRDILIDKNDEYLALFECVTKPIEDLVIIIDGIDELPIKKNPDSDFFKKLQIKIDKNENISAIDTIMGIYFGFFFPGSKVIAYGREYESERLENMQNLLQKNNLSNKKSRVVLELQEFEEEDVKELITRVNCGIESCECEKCLETYNFVKDVEFRNIPSHLVALIKICKYLPNPNFGRITKTKIFIITIFNLLKNHTQTVFFEDVKTFKKLLTFEKAKEFRECIQNIAKISFFSLLDENVTIKVEAYNENDVDYFKYEQTVRGYDICVQIKRDILEQLDFFYLRDLEYDDFILEPHHLSNMEFLASCYIYCHPDEWYLLLQPYFNSDRQTIILPYVAGLYSNESFTKDFVSEILPNTSNRDVETYLSWLFSVEDVRDYLPWGSWYGLKENGDLFPSFDLLNRINEEVDVFENISKKLKEVQTLVCYCPDDFEWYDMEEFKHKLLTNNHNKYNVKTFISEFEKYQIIIKWIIRIRNNEQFNILLEMFNNDRIKFRINYLAFDYSTQHSIHLTKHLKCNALEMGEDCDLRSIDFLLNASSLSTATTSSPTIKCKQKYIDNIAHFNDQQIEKLFSIGLSDVVDNITLRSTFFTDGQLAILEKVERNANKKINIELNSVKFSDMFGLPNLGNRHVSLIRVNDVTDNDVNKLKEHISSGYSDNISNYKIISPLVPFVRKGNYSRDVEHSMFLNMFDVNFTQVSSDVFKNTFSIIPSFSCEDNGHYIPSSHWSSLSADDCRINELRVWYPRSKNFQHFLSIKNNLIQFLCPDKSDLEQLLTHIVNNSNVQFNKQIKVFVVKHDVYNWDYYDEITLFGKKTIKAYKKDHTLDDLLLANSPETFREGNRDTWWCCEISSPAKKNTDDALQGFSDDDESFAGKNEDRLNEIRIINDEDTRKKSCCCLS